MFFDPLYIVILVVTVGITGWAAWRVRSTYAKWSKVDSGINADAFDFARRLLDRQGLQDVKIEPVPGQLTDHYDPRGKVLRVSTAGGGEPAARSVQPDRSLGRIPAGPGTLRGRRRGDRPRGWPRPPGSRARSVDGVRQTIVPAAQLGSGIAPWLIIAGVWFSILELAWVGLIVFGAAVVFTFITLPVEIGASGKALAFVSSLGISGERRRAPARCSRQRPGRTWPARSRRC